LTPFLVFCWSKTAAGCLLLFKVLRNLSDVGLVFRNQKDEKNPSGFFVVEGRVMPTFHPEGFF
jgi:hypothetical protein